MPNIRDRRVEIASRRLETFLIRSKPQLRERVELLHLAEQTPDDRLADLRLLAIRSGYRATDLHAFDV